MRSKLILHFNILRMARQKSRAMKFCRNYLDVEQNSFYFQFKSRLNREGSGPQCVCFSLSLSSLYLSLCIEHASSFDRERKTVITKQMLFVCEKRHHDSATGTKPFFHNRVRLCVTIGKARSRDEGQIEIQICLPMFRKSMLGIYKIRTTHLKLCQWCCGNGNFPKSSHSLSMLQLCFNCTLVE